MLECAGKALLANNYTIMFLYSDISTGILIGRRARYLSTSLWLIIAVVGLAMLAAQFSGRQPTTVALDVGISVMRLLLPLQIILLSQELILREFDRRYFLTSLTYPRPRHHLYLGRMSAILLMVYGTMVMMALALALVCTHIASGYDQSTPPNLTTPYVITILFIAVDLFVITAFAGFIAILASTPSFVLIGTLGFMLISRSYSNVIALLEQNQYVVENSESYQESLTILTYLLPDLGALDIRMISLYNRLTLMPHDWAATVFSNLMYGGILLALAVYIFYRRRFS